MANKPSNPVFDTIDDAIEGTFETIDDFARVWFGSPKKQDDDKECTCITVCVCGCDDD